MDNFSLVIIGITSNLAQIKLIPTLYDLIAAHSLPSTFQIIGVGRTMMDQSAFRAFVSLTLRTPNRHHTHPINPGIEQELFSHLTYLSADLTDLSSYAKLKSILATHKTQNHMFYLATFPSLYGSIFANLKTTGLADEKGGWTRLLVEKPIGSDQDSAKQLNNLFTQYFREDQIFRLDHYLGKETLQNILTFRFGNGILEPLMDAAHIAQIQVTASEDFGIGNRGNYYDQNGAIKDVGQNHLLQMIALTTMDAPLVMDNLSITRERVKVLENLVPDPTSLVIGQYVGYQNEKDIAQGSKTETYFSFKANLNNDRFRGVPIYVRGGKHLSRTATEVAILFKNSPNVLIYRIQPNEGIVLKIKTKKPGYTLELEDSYMQFCYPHNLDLPDAYEKLIIDALRGDQTYFNDANEVDAQWAFTDQLISATHNVIPTLYPQGSWGPQDTIDWLEPSTAFCTI
ncbi:MAG: Glucose-6-phosphate 1-dehydrogenase [Microgenomates group bacterium GW2011_GWA2_46_7]|nr:MAG: Glucose-6-phosphate 1-dehydrogenase [Microgenomates group bacterium GW2011_GWA2_46_7]KKU46592.1 MAG: Glucose-6-phosphate 1-dehydrogenase [Microgenomates group bacterium GW2011_GWC2_46_7]